MLSLLIGTKPRSTPAPYALPELGVYEGFHLRYDPADPAVVVCSFTIPVEEFVASIRRRSLAVAGGPSSAPAAGAPTPPLPHAPACPNGETARPHLRVIR